MHWGSTWQIMTHAGVNPLCICCCPKNAGGTSFDEEHDEAPWRTRTEINPLVRVLPRVDLEKTAPEYVDLIKRDTIAETGVTFDRQSDVPEGGVSIEGASSPLSLGPIVRSLQSPSSPTHDEFGTQIAYQTITFDEWLVLLDSADDD